MVNQDRRRIRRTLAIAVGALLFHALPALAASTITLDGTRDSSERAYTTLPSFAASRAKNTGVAIRDIDNIQLLDAADTGVSFVRTELFRESMQGPGGWNFSTFDSLLAHLSQRGMGALFVLGYKHSLYSPNEPPTTLAQLAASHQNNDVIPNLTTANATKYVVGSFGDGNTLNLDTSGLPKNAAVTDMQGTVLTTFRALLVPEAAGPVFISAPL
jgi:hypothetical protein